MQHWRERWTKNYTKRIHFMATWCIKDRSSSDSNSIMNNVDERELLNSRFGGFEIADCWDKRNKSLKFGGVGCISRWE